MRMELSFVTVMLLVSIFAPSVSVSDYSLLEIKSWCSQVPYPDLCEYYFTHRPKYGNIPIQQKSDFLKISVQLVLERAINASKMAHQLGSKSDDQREMVAWGDCVSLYKNTINILNQTNDPDTKCTPYDIQTWLGTTLTNLETCKQGFVDFGITDNIMPLVLDIVLQNLTINALALNSEACNYHTGTGGSTHHQNGFPAWVSPTERRLMQSSTLDPSFKNNFVVAKDGSGHFTQVRDAVNAASKWGGKARFVIYVKAGVYEELIFTGTNKIMLIGEGIGTTIISGNIKANYTRTIMTAATFIVEGGRFIARNITFRNTAGPHAGQALAIRSDSDYSVYYNCSFEGYQDTLFVRTGRQFFRECNIYGTVDFIMGDATVVFQGCTILARSHYPDMTNTITAQSKSSPLTCSGMCFHKCKLTAAPDLKPIEKSVRTYLGRPWRDFSTVVFMDSYLDSLIDPEGWLPWKAPPPDELYYAEYYNSGPGSSTTNRVKWPGYHVLKNRSEASRFSVRSFIHGDSWLPQTSVPYQLDL